jgi:hypothetical protein
MVGFTQKSGGYFQLMEVSVKINMQFKFSIQLEFFFVLRKTFLICMIIKRNHLSFYTPGWVYHREIRNRWKIGCNGVYEIV